MPATADIYSEQDRLGPTLGVSVALHGALFAALIFGGYLNWRGGGENWGGTGSGGGGAMSATLVSSIPLPASPNSTNILANQSKGLAVSQPKVEEKAPDAIPIPAREARKSDRTRTLPQPKQPPQPVETASNVVPFGQGGPVSGPYGVFNAGGAKGGFSMQGGGGDFGSRYGWYVDVVRRKVSENWLKYEIDPGVSTSRRVYITFDIARDGHPGNVQVEQSSGVPSLDQSAVRALQRIDSFGPLPPDYSGSRVSVEFWFDYRR